VERLLKSYLILVYAFVYLPIAVVALFSFNSSEMIAFPLTGLTARWYIDAVQDERLLHGLGFTFVVAIPTALIATILGGMAALALTRYRFLGKASFAVMLVVPFFIPKIIIAVADVIALAELHLPHSVPTMVVAQSLIVLPFSAMVIASVLVRLDRKLEEAAQDLGATGWQVFRYVLLPLMRNGLMAAYFLAFVISSSEYVVTSFVSGRIQPLSILVASDFRFHLSPKLNALATIIVTVNIAIIVISELFRRRARGVRV
jgi:spermidine/putrescine transport system permease protein